MSAQYLIVWMIVLKIERLSIGFESGTSESYLLFYVMFQFAYILDKDVVIHLLFGQSFSNMIVS